MAIGHTAIGLRSLSEEDAPTVTKWMQSSRLPETIPTLDREHFRQEKTWHSFARLRHKNHFFLITDEGVPFGLSVLYDIDKEKRSAFTGTAIFDTGRQGKGYGNVSKVLQHRYAFENLGLEAVYARVASTDHRMQSGLKAFGYVEARPASGETTATFELTRSAWKEWVNRKAS